MRTKELPLRPAMVQSPIVAVTQTMVANAFKALCPEARLLAPKALVKALQRTDRQLHPSS